MPSDPADILYQIVSTQLSPSDDRESVTRRVQAVGQQALIDQETVDCVIERLVVERYAATLAAAELPRLFVDWGELPRIGSTARPQFSLVCPGYATKPELHVVVDRDLDHDESDPLRRPRCEESGLWTFYVPFRLTTDGIDCRPGQYMIEVNLTFPDAHPGQPRFFGTRLRLMVKADKSDNSVLEISGDGQSVVNLQGCDLRAFSKVVLKAGQDGIINLQEMSPSSREGSTVATPQKECVSFEYDLKIDLELEQRLPHLSKRFTERSHIERAGLYFESGRRILLLAKRRISLGRSRDNDIVIRFFPRSAINNELCHNVSRTHAALELTDDGLMLVDESSTGTEINSSVVDKYRMLPNSFVGETFRVELGCSLTVKKSFELELEMFGPERDSDSAGLLLWDNIYLKTLGERMPRIWQTALEMRINAIRLGRAENLADEEGYVILFREVLLGGSRSACAITLPTRTLQPAARLLYAGRCFWVERLGERGVVELNNVELKPKELTPLAIGHQLNIDGVKCEFREAVQCGLDETQQ